jgi:hypothetical protein
MIIIVCCHQHARDDHGAGTAIHIPGQHFASQVLHVPVVLLGRVLLF